MRRRDFLKWSGAMPMAPFARADFSHWKAMPPKKETPLLRTARNCVLISLQGAPSHVDTFDFKQNAWTPADLGGIQLPGGALWPDGIMPRLAQMGDHFSLIRSMRTRDNNHQRAQFLVETGHPFVPANSLREEIPPMGSLISFELAGQRQEGDLYPVFLSFDHRPKDPGLVGEAHSSFFISNDFGPHLLEHQLGPVTFDTNLNYLFAMDPLKAAVNPDLPNLNHLWEQAARLVNNDLVSQAFAEDSTAPTGIGRILSVTSRILAQNAGARFCHIAYGGWDDHGSIYSAIKPRARALDLALARLIDDMLKTPGVMPGKTLLDETLIVVVGEFGRTPGALNSVGGRDHYSDLYAALIAGGGTKGGRALGVTDEIGATLVDAGWAEGRQISFGDIAATVYSAMGIDYRKIIVDTPSGRPFQYVSQEPWLTSVPTDILELFQ